MTASIGSQRGSFGKGRSDLREPCDKLAAQRFVVDITFYRMGAKDPASCDPTFGRQRQQFGAQRLIRRYPVKCRADAFLEQLPCLWVEPVSALVQFFLQLVHHRAQAFQGSPLLLKQCSEPLDQKTRSKISAYSVLVELVE